MRKRSIQRLARRLVGPSARRLLGTITHVSTVEPAVALTFDDGPTPDTTPRLLALLERYGARATFFMVGEAALRHPDLVRQVAERGHAIGNHSWDHPALTVLAGRHRRRQISACQLALGPHGHRLFRYPYGLQSLRARLDAFWLGFEVIQWNVSPGDWCEIDPHAIANRIVAGIRPGSIVVLHDGLYDRGQPGLGVTLDRLPVVDRGAMLRAVEIVLQQVSHQYRFVTVPELLRLGRPERPILCRPVRNRGTDLPPRIPPDPVGDLQ